MAHPTSKTPVIILAFANDDGRSLRQLDEEQKVLRQIFRQTEKEGKCQLEILAAVTAADLIKAFQEYRGRIRIFHYGGHSSEDEIFLKNAYQQQKGIKADSLATFLALQEDLELVFLNSCLSLGQAEAYHQAGVKAVIATDREIGDRAARDFAWLFYSSLASGAGIGQAYREAEKGFQLQFEEILRGIKLKEDAAEYQLPWQLHPKEPHSWRLPMVAKQLTRIPSINLEREFFGRETDMQRLKAKLENTPKIVLMNGLGGIGKTVLATAFVQQYGDDYDHLAWINRGEDLITSVALNEDLADTLDMPLEQEEEMEARFRRILRRLHQLPGRNLLVIDNAQEQVAQKEVYDFLPGAPNWRVLLTSRLNLSGFDHLPLDTLAPGAARALFRTYYRGSYMDEELEDMLKEIGYHTLTVELLAKLLDKLNNILSISELTDILRQKQLDDPDLQEQIWARHSGEERGIYLHLIKAFELIRLSYRELWLLKQFIVLPVERYAVATLADFLQEMPLGLNKTLNSLAANGWLTLHEDKTFSIHRLICQVAAYQLQPDFADVEVLVESMVQKMWPDTHESFISKNVPWITYATTVENFLTGEKNERIALLQNNIALVYSDLGQYDQALKYHKKALAILEAMLEANHPDLASSYNNIASVYSALGQHYKAEEYQAKADSIKKRTFSDC